MVTTNLIGGLGNNLFQIANLLNVSHNLNVDYSIPNNVNRGQHGVYNSQKLEIEDLFCTDLINVGTVNDGQMLTYNHHDLDINNGFHYSKVKETNNTIYNGYFQSEKYFKDIDINNYLVVKPNITEKMLTKYNIPKNNKTLSIHCRFGGDRNPNTTFGKGVQHFHKNVSKNFYENAYNIVVSNHDVDDIIVVSDLPELANEMMSLITPNFKIINEDTINSFVLLSSTTYSIIGNSTFSWWSSYLNKNNRLTICPKTEWFGPGYGNVNLDDLFPDKWICL